MRWQALGLALWLIGCAGTETGNPSFDGTLGYAAYSSQPAQVALRGEASVVVEAAWLVLGDVRFDRQERCGDAAAEHVDVPGLGAGDHAGSHAPASSVEFASGRYCTVRMALQLPATQPDGAPAELTGHSILISGKQRGRAFRIASSLAAPVTLRASAAGGFELDDAQSGVLLGFDLNAWLLNISWSDAAPDGSGTAIIDATHAPEVLRQFEANVAQGVKLFRDRDGDGLLDAEPEELAHAPE
ncbi:MAG TPA: hypothetical protein VJV78_03635 [Polyangiales bacterium]|nr:hypothetical protein [Polyangiales bacterium]